MACQEAFHAHFFVREMPLDFWKNLRYDVDKELRRKNKVDNLLRKECLIMKNLKKIFSMIMITTILATMGVSAVADTNGLQRRVPSCDLCGGGTYLSDQEYKERVIGYPECPDTPRYNDTLVEYTTIYYFTCTNCGIVMEDEITNIVQECRHP